MFLGMTVDLVNKLDLHQSLSTLYRVFSAGLTLNLLGHAGLAWGSIASTLTQDFKWLVISTSSFCSHSHAIRPLYWLGFVVSYLYPPAPNQ